MADGKTTVFERRERSATQYTRGLFQRESDRIEKTGGEGERRDKPCAHRVENTGNVWMFLPSEKTD